MDIRSDPAHPLSSPPQVFRILFRTGTMRNPPARMVRGIGRLLRTRPIPLMHNNNGTLLLSKRAGGAAGWMCYLRLDIWLCMGITWVYEEVGLLSVDVLLVIDGYIILFGNGDMKM